MVNRNQRQSCIRGGYMKLAIPKRFYEDEDWAYKNYADLVKKYGDRWVAIYNKKIVSSSNDGYKALDRARKITKDDKIPIVFVEKMPHVY